MKLFGLNISFGRKIENRRSALGPRNTSPFSRVPSHGRSYDAAATNRHNSNHWQFADARDADSIIFADLATLRNRCRYEMRNNCYAKGIARTLSDDIVGEGPLPQVDSGNPEHDDEVEDKFLQWCKTCDLRGKWSLQKMLWQATGKEQCQSGEAFFVMQSVSAEKKAWPAMNEKEVSLRLQMVESDRVTTPGDLFGVGMINDKIRDGIEVDENGKPLFYYILKKHPGSTYAIGGFGDYDKVPAEYVIHLFEPERAEQSRGVPLFTPALSIFAQLRRFTLATLDAAEQAANLSGVMQSEQTGTEDDVTVAGDEVEIPRNTLLGLPSGTTMAQLKAEHPAGTYKDFKCELLNEAARCIGMPFNIAAANSSGYNYASGRLDHQTYDKGINTVRKFTADEFLAKVFWPWYREARLIPNYFRHKPKTAIILEWNWIPRGHVDPLKEAAGQTKRFQNKTTNLKIEYAKQGKDWKREIKQSKKELDLLLELGLIDEGEHKNEMENIARAVRAGVPVAVAEARTALGFESDPPTGPLLRFNDQDVLQYHIESGILEINEVRTVLGLKPKPWGNKPVRKNGVSVIDTETENETTENESEENENETETEKE